MLILSVTIMLMRPLIFGGGGRMIGLLLLGVCVCVFRLAMHGIPWSCICTVILWL